MENHDTELAERVSKLAVTIWNECYAGILTKEQIDFMVKKFDSKDAVLENLRNGFVYHIPIIDGKDAGYFGFVLEGDSVYLSKAYLRKEFRGKGLGRKCLEVVEQYARDNGKRRIYLRVNKKNTSARAYESWGFKKYDEDTMDIDHGFVMDEYLMEKFV